MRTDTIAAIASGMSTGGIGIIRVSGPEALEIVDSVFLPKKKNKCLSDCSTYTMHYGHIVDGKNSKECKIIDEVIVLIMKAPHSYTAEDVVEIDCHGGVLVLKKILQLLIHAGARIAEPGEFTKRAFLNGRIDLSQAESVMDIIQAKNQFALESSIKQLQGSVKNKVLELRDIILHETAFIEAALDDPEHYELDGYGEKLSPIVDNVILQIQELLRSSDNGRILKEGISTVIVGKPNAGKSSLLNMLLGCERAIVTDIAGTTRDILEEQLNLDGICLNMIDTAGIRDTDDKVEQIGVERAKQYVSAADLVLYVVDSSRPFDQDDDEIIDLIREKKVIVLFNKCDLDSVIDESQLKERLDFPFIYCSAKEGNGLTELHDQIKELFFVGELSYNDEVYITNLRHKECLIQAAESLVLVKQSINDCVPEDFYTVDLLNAYGQLGLIIGESVTDDLVDKIFHDFCMGK